MSSKRVTEETVPKTVSKNTTYDTLPTDLVFCIDITGSEGIGKTHTALTFPGDIVFIDTELKAETVIPKFLPSKVIKWKTAELWDDVVWAVNDGLKNPNVKTIIFDSGGDLVSLAAEQWCRETGHQSVFPITNYGHVYNKIDALTTAIKKKRKYLVSTSRLKDEWVGDQSTGRRIRDGYKNVELVKFIGKYCTGKTYYSTLIFPWDLHIALEIVWGLKDDNNRTWYPERKFGKVNKNNFHGVDGSTGINYGKPYIFDVSFNGIVEELTKPWGKGVPAKETYKRIAEEAKVKFG